MAFTCEGCKQRKRERERRFENTDWCDKCCDAELVRTSAGVDVDGMPNIRAEPPAYIRRPR